MSARNPGPFLTAPYKKLGFREYPFSVSADPRFLYLSSQHQVVLEAIHQVVGNRQGLAVVEGDVGLGKSTLARRLHDIYNSVDGVLTLYLHTASYKTSFEALNDITSKYGLSPRRSESALIGSFEKWLVEQRKAGNLPIIIIDDAQNMKPPAFDAFQHIYNFDVREKLAQVILVGQTEVRELIAQKTGLLSRVVSWQTILPLSAGDALAMINFRCQVAGRDGPMLTENAFNQLWEYTRGIPRTIVIVCGEALAIMEREGGSTADETVIDKAIAIYERRPERSEAQRLDLFKGTKSTTSR